MQKELFIFGFPIRAVSIYRVLSETKSSTDNLYCNNTWSFEVDSFENFIKLSLGRVEEIAYFSSQGESGVIFDNAGYVFFKL